MYIFFKITKKILLKYKFILWLTELNLLMHIFVSSKVLLKTTIYVQIIFICIYDWNWDITMIHGRILLKNAVIFRWKNETKINISFLTDSRVI